MRMVYSWNKVKCSYQIIIMIREFGLSHELENLIRNFHPWRSLQQAESASGTGKLQETAVLTKMLPFSCKYSHCQFILAISVGKCMFANLALSGSTSLR